MDALGGRRALYIEELRFVEFEQPRFAEHPSTLTYLRSGGRVDAYMLREGGWVWIRFERLATYRFPESPVEGALRCEVMPDPDVERAYVVDQFYRSITPYAFEAYGFENVHGCALRTPGGALVIAARPKTGKTTLGLLMSRRGYPLLADDAVIIDPAPAGEQGRPSLRTLPFVPMARRETAVRFGLPVRQRIDPPKGRVKLGDPIPLAAIVFLARGGHGGEDRPGSAPVSTTNLERLRPAEAFEALLSRAHFVDPAQLSGDRRSISGYLRVVAHVPVFRLTYPSGFDVLEEVAELIERDVVRAEASAA